MAMIPMSDMVNQRRGKLRMRMRTSCRIPYPSLGTPGEGWGGLMKITAPLSSGFCCAGQALLPPPANAMSTEAEKRRGRRFYGSPESSLTARPRGSGSIRRSDVLVAFGSAALVVKTCGGDATFPWIDILCIGRGKGLAPPPKDLPPSLHVVSAPQLLFTTRAGTPTATELAGTSFNTTAFAPIALSWPIMTLPNTATPQPR